MGKGNGESGGFAKIKKADRGGRGRAIGFVKVAGEGV